MAQSLAGIYSTAQGHEPLIQGVPQTPSYGFEGAPFMARMGMGAMFAQPFLTGAMGRVGMMPMGVGHDQNVYDTIKNQQFTQAQQMAMAEAAQADRQRFFQTFRGLAAISGTPFGGEQRRAAGSLADAAAFAAPMMAHLAPDALEQMSGLRGSATVLARRVMEASRYRADPVTGRMGMTGESAGAMARTLYQDLYEGPAYRQMQGISAGRLGDLFSQLQHRGLVEGPGAGHRAMAQSTIEGLARDRPDMYQAAINRLLAQGPAKGGLATAPAGATKLTSEELDKLSLDPAVADRLRSFDAEKIKRSLKSYVGAVGAMRDIFGDMGRPDAPMRELVGALEALTGGAVGKIDPTRLGQMARQTYNLAKQTGMTMDAVTTLQSHAAYRGQQLGLEPIFAAGATQGALGFGGAYRAAGQAAHTAWGAMNADQITQADANLRMQAAGSVMANRLGAVMRMSEMAGGFKPGTEAAAMAEAIARRQTDYTFGGKTQSLQMGDERFYGIMGQAQDRTGRKLGITESMVRDVEDQRFTNREYGERFGAMHTVRRLQGPTEVKPFIADTLKETLISRLSEAGHAGPDVTADVNRMAARATERIFQMPTADFSDNTRRTATIGRILEEEMARTRTGAQMRGAIPVAADRANLFRMAGGQFMGAADRNIRESGLAGMENMQNVHRLFNTETMAAADQQQEQADFTSRMQEALTPLGRGSAMQRAMQFLQDVRPDEPDKVQKLIGQAFGGVKKGDINLAIMRPMEELHRRRTKIEDLRRRAAGTTDSAAKSRLQDQLSKELELLGQDSAQLAKIGEQYGYYKDGGISRDEARRAVRQAERVTDATRDLASVRGGFGLEVSGAEIDAALKRWNEEDKPATTAEAKAVLLARRKNQIVDINEGTSDAAKAAIAQTKKAVLDATGNTITDTVAKQMALTTLRKNLYVATPAEVEGIRADPADRMAAGAAGREEAKALVLARRQATSPRATDEQVVGVLREFTNLNAPQARMLADARQRAKRFGIPEEEIKGYMVPHEDPITKTQVPGLAEYDAIDKATKVRTISQFAVAPKDVETYKAENAYYANYAIGDIDPTTGQWSPITNATDRGKAEKNREEIESQIRKDRQKERNRRYDQFFSDPEGARYREDIDMTTQDTENFITKMTQSPEMTRRLGTEAVRIQQRLRATEERLRVLASLYTRGDRARLTAGQLGIDTSTREGMEKFIRITGELGAIQTEQTMLKRQVETPTLSNRLVRTGEAMAARQAFVENAATRVKGKSSDDVEMRELAGRHAAWLRANSPTEEAFDDPRTGKRVIYTKEQYDRFNKLYTRDFEPAARERQGDIEIAREKLGIPPDQTPTTEQQASIDRLARTYTEERERGETGGRVLRVGTQEAGYEHFVANIGDYVGDRAEDQDLIGIAAARQAWHAAKKPVAAGFKYQKVQYNFTQADHLRMRAAYAARYEDVARERVGNIDEARAVLGFTPGQKLTPDEQKKLDEMTYAAGLARRIKPEDREMFDTFIQRDKSMAEMARVHGTSVKEMNRLLIQNMPFSGDIKFTEDERKRIEAVRGDYDKAAAARLDVEKRLQAAKDPAAAAKLTKEYDVALKAEAKAVVGVDDIRRAYGGLTNEELFKGRIQGDIRLTPQEVESRDKAKKQIDAGRTEQQDIQAKINKAMDELTKLPDSVTAPATAGRRMALLGEIDRLTGQQDQARSKEEAGHQQATKTAGGAGLLGGELITGVRSPTKLKELSGDQASRMASARSAYEQASENAKGYNLAVREAQRALGQLRPEDTVARTQARQDLNAAIIGREKSRDEMRKAQAIVADDAAGRGVSVPDYLAGKGQLPEGTANFYREQAGEQRAALPAILKSLVTVGLTRPQELLRMQTYEDALEKYRKNAAAVENVPGMQLAREAVVAFGQLAPDAATMSGDPDAIRLAQMANTTEGRRILQSTIGTRNFFGQVAAVGATAFAAQAAKLETGTDKDKARAVMLRDKVSRMTGPQAGINVMMTDWADVEKARLDISHVSGRDAIDAARKLHADKLERFRLDYDLTNFHKFSTFEKGAEAQIGQKFLDLGMGGKKFSLGDMADRLGAAIRGEYGKADTVGGGKGAPDRMYITGEFTMKGDGRVSVNGWGTSSYKNDVPP